MMVGCLSGLAGLTLANAYISHFVGGWASIRLAGRHPMQVGSMVGKVVVVTGANAGIGLGAVRELLLLGATVVLCCRSRERGNAAKASLPAGSNVEVMDLDLGSLTSIRTFAELFRKQYIRLDVLVLNAGKAGSFLGDGGFQLTSDGLEEFVGANFLGHFHLTNLLLPVLRSTPQARVIANTSVAAANSYPQGIDIKTWTERCSQYSDWMQYGQSKLALLLFIRALQKREPALLCLACHPGVVDGTSLMHGQSSSPLERLYSLYLFKCLAMRQEDGWRNVVYLAAAAHEKLKGGGFYFPVGRLVSWPWPRIAHAFQRAAALQAPVHMEPEHGALWDESEAVIKQIGG